jgi:uncharacterized FlaG/YvyC family protein
MKSFLKEMEEKFMELEDYCDACNRVKSKCICDESELDEISTTGGVAGYNTPGAFLTPTQYEKKKKKIKYESVNKPASWTMGGYQTPEDEEEEYTDKFPFADHDGKWQHKNYEYPSKNLTHTPGTANKKNKTMKLTTEDVLEKKYEELLESYQRFATEDKHTSPERKVKNTIKEIAKKLQEIETMVNYNTRLKTESGVAASTYGPGTQKALTKISERLIKISERVRALGE